MFFACEERHIQLMTSIKENRLVKTPELLAELENIARQTLQAAKQAAQCVGGDPFWFPAWQHNVAQVLSYASKHQEATKLYATALDGYLQLLGPHHPKTRALLTKWRAEFAKQDTQDESELLQMCEKVLAAQNRS